MRENGTRLIVHDTGMAYKVREERKRVEKGLHWLSLPLLTPSCLVSLNQTLRNCNYVTPILQLMHIM